MAQQDQWPNGSNLAYVEALYEQYLRDPGAIDKHWRATFDGWADRSRPEPVKTLQPSFKPRSLFHPPPASANGNGRTAVATPAPAVAAPPPAPAGDMGSLQHRVDQLIRNYRVRGHIVSAIDPLGSRTELPAELDPGYYGFTEADMDRPVTSNVPGDTLREIIAQLSNTYCREIGVQFMHIDNLQVREWLQRRMEGTANRIDLSRKKQIRILTRLTDAVIFEQFIQKKFIGAKSFSLEGAESLIPLLDMALETGGEQGVREVVIGMAHRGRLNVLANILGKSPAQIFREFHDLDPRRHLGAGDVKYHLGYSGDWHTRHGKNIHLSLCFNPSHLEFVNPVAIGRMRAKQDRSGRGTRGERGMVLLIHGDAAFAGEGITQETLNLSQLDGYGVGGALHVVVNNQIGFTTGTRSARSCRYATDVAKMLQIPIFHVNGEAPEAVAQVVDLAMAFRAEFKRDVVIDMYCYRRRGHNETDEPQYTQPVMYGKIDRKPTVRESYLGHLLKLGGVTREDADRIAKRRTELLDKDLTAARSEHYAPSTQPFAGLWGRYHGGKEAGADEAHTAVPAERLGELLQKTTRLPEGFNAHKKLKRFFEGRHQMAAGEKPLDWSAAEALAYGSLATEGHRVRLSGQDAQRGTFSHRHAVLHDAKDGHDYSPLQHLDPDQAPIDVWNSPLSEAGVLGFDYGYSLDYPEGLVIWEAQFGDFVNAAQVIIDQFITSAEDKWRRLSGLVLLLPHGFEGMGPEHSSARLERFLMLAAEDNIQVVNPTTPAQLFHLLRRQVLRPWRKPLIVMTPKSLLRHNDCVSSLDELAEGTFKRIIPDDRAETRENVTRVLLCSGKVYYDLYERREKLGRKDIAILRLEQYYPFPEESLRGALMRYRDKVPVLWVQEEPENQGAWPYLRMKFGNRLFDRLDFHAVSRPPSASPATGSRAAHLIEHESLISEAFGGG